LREIIAQYVFGIDQIHPPAAFFVTVLLALQPFEVLARPGIEPFRIQKMLAQALVLVARSG
jgi:hypothetical protein